MADGNNFASGTGAEEANDGAHNMDFEFSQDYLAPLPSLDDDNYANASDQPIAADNPQNYDFELASDPFNFRQQIS